MKKIMEIVKDFYRRYKDILFAILCVVSVMVFAYEVIYAPHVNDTMVKRAKQMVDKYKTQCLIKDKEFAVIKRQLEVKNKILEQALHASKTEVDKRIKWEKEIAVKPYVTMARLYKQQKVKVSQILRDYRALEQKYNYSQDVILMQTKQLEIRKTQIVNLKLLNNEWQERFEIERSAKEASEALVGRVLKAKRGGSWLSKVLMALGAVLIFKVVM